MEEVRGIVLEVQSRHLIILTRGGNYLRVPHPGGRIRNGDEITSSYPSTLLWPKLVTAASSLAVAAVILIFLMPILLPYNSLIGDEIAAEGYLVIDINPSFELVFDENLIVTSFHPLNENAVLLLNEVERGKHLYITLNRLLERSVLLGFLEPGRVDNLVILSIVQPDQFYVSPDNLADLVEDKLNQLNITCSVGIFEAEEQMRKDALLNEVSLNRQIIKEVLSRRGYDDPSWDFIPISELLYELEDTSHFSQFRNITLPELPSGAFSEEENRPVIFEPGPEIKSEDKTGFQPGHEQKKTGTQPPVEPPGQTESPSPVPSGLIDVPGASDLAPHIPPGPPDVLPQPSPSKTVDPPGSPVVAPQAPPKPAVPKGPPGSIPGN
jgi:hypothetical protein